MADPVDVDPDRNVTPPPIAVSEVRLNRCTARAPAKSAAVGTLMLSLPSRELLAVLAVTKVRSSGPRHELFSGDGVNRYAFAVRGSYVVFWSKVWLRSASTIGATARSRLPLYPAYVHPR